MKAILLLIAIQCTLFATEFTVSSYNCGGLSEHYDYLRAGAMQKLMQERYNAEPEAMALNEKIQKLALKILFTLDEQERTFAQQEWDQKGYQRLFEQLTASPNDPQSPNGVWHQKMNELITSYKVRPVVIYDQELNQLVDEQLGKSDLQKMRARMAKRIFAHFLKYDIICLQEGDYLRSSTFPKSYEVIWGKAAHSKNGIAWNKERFQLIENLGEIDGRGIAVKLNDKETGKTILVASGHLTGCNPYRQEQDDAAKGDTELKATVNLLESHEADLAVIGMDSNVTSLHPRLHILKETGFQLDYENHLELTCTNPYQVLNTRIDWIAIKSKKGLSTSITNIPVMSVGLNSLQTNISDHKPIAAKIEYFSPEP